MSLLEIAVGAELWGFILFSVCYIVLIFARSNLKNDKCIRYMLFVAAILLLSDACTWIFNGRAGTLNRVILEVSNFLVYLCNYVIIAIFGNYFWFMIMREKEKTPVPFLVYWAVVTFFIFVHIIGRFFGWIYYIDANNVYHRGPLFIASNIPGFLGVAVIFWGYFRYHRRLSGYTKMTTICYLVFPIVATIIQLTLYGIPLQVLAIAMSTLIAFSVREQDLRVELKRALSDENKNKQSLLELNDNLQKRMSIIQSVIKTYYASYYIDLENNVYTELSTNVSGKARYAPKGEPQAALYDMSKFLILPEFTNDMREFVTLSTLNERMAKKNVITMRFIGVTAGWSEAIFIAGDRNEDGTLKSAIWASRMIHDEKKREDEYMENLLAAKVAAESANAAKTAFLFNMSHDIRTPMNAIIGYTDLIEKNYDNKEKSMDYLHKAQKANQFLLSLINNVLEMARIESGKSEINLEPCNIKQFISGVSRLFEEQMATKGLAFKRSVSLTSEYVLCDISKISEIYLNLLSNSFKYTPSGGTVTATLVELPSEKEGYITLKAEVKDTGVGMSEDFLPHIFEEFTREKSSTESRQQGTGLGMPIVKKLVEQLGGTIDVESELGKGTKFTVILDFKKASTYEIEEVDDSSVEEIDFKGKRILLAEDNDLNAEIAIEILQEAGFKVERAIDGIAALDMMQKHKAKYYDLILMDIQMPNMDGYTATKAIRSLEDKDKAGITIIAMTANAFEEDKKNAFAAGMDGHLAKPINVKTLLSTLAQIFKK